MNNLQKEAINALSKYIEELNSSNDPKNQKRANLISYWIKDYVRMLSWENKFIPTKNIVYHRGDVIKVNFGYRIGSEQGGLHYAIVIDDNPHNSPVITVVPLTSLKPNESIESIHPDSVYLDNEIYTKLLVKSELLRMYSEKDIDSFVERLERINDKQSALETVKESFNDKNEFDKRLINNLISDLEREREELEKSLAVSREQVDTMMKVHNEIRKMKVGSIALVNQITTISKIRIYDPKNTHDVLFDVRLSPEKLDLINAKLKKLYIHE